MMLLLISALPFSLVYKLSDFLAYVLKDVLKYRRDVVQENLRRAFPDKPQEELDRITDKFYLHLADITVESFKTSGMSVDQVIERFKMLNPEMLMPYFNEKRDFLALTGHYGNWEWGAIGPPSQTGIPMTVFYKPLSNTYIDSHIRKLRKANGFDVRPIYETSATFAAYAQEGRAFAMVIDQNPANVSKAYWEEFLGVQTAFLHGAEKHGRSRGMPAVYIDIQRVGRGKYELTLSKLCENVADLEDGEITRRFAKKLESVILKNPESWLWSHRRWKHSPPAIKG